MSDNTRISWTDATWNPLRGCTRISPGCQNCYAERMCSRGLPNLKSPTTGDDFAVKTPSGPRWTGKVELIESALEIPMRWRKPRKIFPCSMSDLFHESVPDEWIDRILARMAGCRWHTFQVLTKRASRQRDYFARFKPDGQGWVTPGGVAGPESLCPIDAARWPIPNVWLGVSVEDQQRADERIPHLLSTPAAVRWVSVEPMLGPVDLTRWLRVGPNFAETCSQYRERATLDWVIVGGESGSNARLFDVAAGRALFDQCQAAGVATFWKQFGSRPAVGNLIGKDAPALGFRDRAGADPAEWPEWARVQQFPEVRR